MNQTTIQSQFKEFIAEGVSSEALLNILSLIPDGDDQEMEFLELASRCILEVSNLVDESYSDLDRPSRLIKKFQIMSKMLEIKASELQKSE